MDDWETLEEYLEKLDGQIAELEERFPGPGYAKVTIKPIVDAMWQDPAPLWRLRLLHYWYMKKCGRAPRVIEDFMHRLGEDERLDEIPIEVLIRYIIRRFPPVREGEVEAKV